MPGAFRRQDLGNLARTRFNGFLLPNSSTVSQTKTEKSEKAGPFYTGPHASFCLGIVPSRKSDFWLSFRAAWVPTAFGDYAFAPLGLLRTMLVVARFGFGPSKAGGQFVRMYFNTSLRR